MRGWVDLNNRLSGVFVFIDNHLSGHMINVEFDHENFTLLPKSHNIKHLIKVRPTKHIGI